jgi:hypothetical protein
MRQHLHSGARSGAAGLLPDLAKDAIDAAWEMTNTVDLSLPVSRATAP